MATSAAGFQRPVGSETMRDRKLWITRFLVRLGEAELPGQAGMRQRGVSGDAPVPPS